MRIVITLSSLQSGGAERVAVIWAKAFADAGHDVVLATNKTRADEPFVYPVDQRVQVVRCWGFHLEEPQGVKKLTLKYCPLLYKGVRKIRGYLETIVHLRRVYDSFKPQVVISLLQPTSLLALLAVTGKGIPVIATEHNSFERPADAEARLTLSGRFFKFFVNKFYPVVTVLTEADKRAIGNRLKNVYVLPNPLALQSQEECNRLRTKRIVAAGRLDAWRYKGFDLLIEAWGMIASKYPDWTLDIAGESHRGDYYVNELQRMIKENHCEGSCRLSGFHKNMTEYFGDSEIFVLSSRYEGFGLVLIEAMSQGCACIAADYRGRQSEMILDESMGLCIPPSDVQAMSAAIERMITDNEYRAKVQKNAIMRSKAYSPDLIERKWETILSKVVQ